MKQSGAPALSRGVAILRVLGDGKSRRLEDLTRMLSIPKSTLLRLLGVLVDEQLVARAPATRQYSAVVRIVPVGGGLPDRARLRAAMAELRDATGRTVEWYLPAEEGMVLAERVADTRGEVHVLAQIGFLRVWRGELDAIAALGLAFFHPADDSSGMWSYRPSGQHRPLSAAEAAERIAEARQNGVIGDDVLNANAVRRSAAVVGAGSRTWGVLAIAEHVGPGSPDRRQACRAALKEAARKLTTGPWPPQPTQEEGTERCEC